MSIEYKTTALSKKHVKDQFSCGEESLDNYIKYSASQDLRKKLAGVFVLEGKETNEIKGFYTLSSSNILTNDLPENFIKKFPSYPNLPATLIGRLAVNKKFQGAGLGEVLLLDALYRSYEASKNIGSVAVIVDALNDDVVKFYESYGFIKFSTYRKLYIPMKTVQSLF